ncbi:hypothetical protein HMPREF9099_02722 [Lachnospiraceae bacterium oral taxon 082 str. F0431]|nr:hypothetical protein HMPREF9099_02722 [Lachnospiraceae bacterium oral taxon 082 str. F0431]
MVMANSMDSYVSKGKSDVQDKLKEGTDSIAKIGDEFQGVKNQLQDMPGGLDVDLLAMIKDAENSGRSEVLQDIDATKSAIIDTAKSAADSIKGDVQGKISENSTAKGKLEGINSKYGKDAISQAKSAIDANSKKGEDLLKLLDDAIKDADQSVQGVKDKL